MMSTAAYELLALAMRYVFAGLILLIVLRAWFGASEGGERAKPGMRYPLTLEGTIGSGRRADIRVRHHSVRARHAIYQMTDEGLFVRGHANKRLGTADGYFAREMLLRDGDVLRVGSVALMLVLSDGGNPVPEAHRGKPRRRPEREDAGEDFGSGFVGGGEDELFRVEPSAMRAPRDEYDEYDGYDEYDDD